jgi:hypothetical protein
MLLRNRCAGAASASRTHLAEIEHQLQEQREQLHDARISLAHAQQQLALKDEEVGLPCTLEDVRS